ncbi:MAG: hypothetical protein D6705_00150 [Deltaproteobacteria bacterium]|nr:MAG: hypothetical protein D6705_00150 [Deltaproteobacteria bacterium]
MEDVARLLWGPHLVFGLPLVALVLAWRLRRKRHAEGPAPGAAATRRTVALLCGLPGAAAVALAVDEAGPGVLPWYWLSTLPFVLLGRTMARVPAVRATRRAGPAGWWIWWAAAAAILPAGIHGFGQIHTTVLGWPEWSAGFVLVPLLFACGFAGARPWLLRLTLPATAVFAAMAVLALLETPGRISELVEAATTQAFAYVPAGAGAYAGAVTVAMAHAVPAALASTHAPFLVGGGDWNPRAYVPVALAASLGLGTVTGLAVAAKGPDASPAERALLPMERPHSRGLRPNPEVGQTVVLPEKTPLEPGNAYAMVLRSDPRGHEFFQARLLAEKNMVVAPAYQVLDRTDTIVFRPKHAFQARNPGWDVRVPVTRTERTVQGRRFYEFRPQDPNLDLRRLIVRRALGKTPYLVADDFHFIGRVARAVAPDELGEHLALFEARPKGAPPNPAFHEFFRMGYRGPYADDGQPRPPWAIVGREDFDGAPGTLLHLEFRSPPRGANILGITKTGRLEAPPWRFLLGADTVVLRHADGPEHDVYVPVRGFMDEGRLVFESTVDAWKDFRVVARTEHLSGPYLVTPPYRFSAEVRRGHRFPGQLEERRALVPLHPHGEPMGPDAALPYDPHPGALFTTDLAGPFYAAGDGLGPVAAHVRHHLGLAGGVLAWLFGALAFAGFVAAVVDALGPVARTLLLAGAAVASPVALGAQPGSMLAYFETIAGLAVIATLAWAVRRIRT